MARRQDFLAQGVTRLLKLNLQAVIASGASTWRHPEYFIAQRTGEAVAVLVRWVQDGMTRSADEVADLVLAQANLALDLELASKY